MGIIQTVNQYDFHSAFENMGRVNQFTYDGRIALFEYLEEYSDGMGEPFELDVIALCCEFSEYDSAVECIRDCGYGFDPFYSIDEETDEEDRAEEAEENALDWLREQTTVITFDSGVIIQDF